MKTLLFCLIHFVFLSNLRAQDLDAELGSVAESLAKQIKESGKKKISVVDFSDLQGNFNELGRFVAEQLTVNLVTTGKEFRMIDRANLQRILEEHKLSMSGLLDPENAKKLGQISGVDALILGNLTPFQNDVQLTAKIIATDSAEIIGATKSRLKKSKDIADLMDRSTTVNPKPDVSKPVDAKPKMAIEKNSEQIEDLLVKVESLRVVNQSSYQFATLTLILANLSTTEKLVVAVEGDTYRTLTLVNSRGDVFLSSSTQGVKQAYMGNGDIRGELTEIAPGKAIKCTFKSQLVTSDLKDFRPYRLEASLLIGTEVNGRYRASKHNLIMDIE